MKTKITTSKTLFVIVDEEYNFVQFNSKTAWATAAAAKNAYNCHMGGNWDDRHLFDDQTQYRLVEITNEGVMIELCARNPK
jgi:hypothetical protein